MEREPESSDFKPPPKELPIEVASITGLLLWYAYLACTTAPDGFLEEPIFSYTESDQIPSEPSEYY